MFVLYNPNPTGTNVGDCVIRAVSKAMNQDWDTTYLDLAMIGFEIKDMPSANRVWGSYLRRNGFRRFNLPNTCPECYTVRDFCMDYPYGIFVLATGSHVIAVISGNYYDSWDSGNETVAYLFKKGR